METYCREIGDGAPIVYFHGWGCDGSIFAPVAVALPDYHNYLIDFDGFGKSPFPPLSGYTVFDYADRMAEFFARKNLDNAVIVAHSFGCRVAMVLAVKYPHLVNRILLFAPAGLRRKSFKRWWKTRVFKLYKLFRPKKAKQCGSDDYKNCPLSLKNTFVKVVNKDLSKFAKRISCKTLIIAAKNDTAVPIADARRLHKLIRASECQELDGDHFALFYSPKAFAEIIRLFAEE